MAMQAARVATHARQQSKKKAEAEALRATASNHHYFDRKAAIKSLKEEPALSYIVNIAEGARP